MNERDAAAPASSSSPKHATNRKSPRCVHCTGRRRVEKQGGMSLTAAALGMPFPNSSNIFVDESEGLVVEEACPSQSPIRLECARAIHPSSTTGAKNKDARGVRCYKACADFCTQTEYQQYEQPHESYCQH